MTSTGGNSNVDTLQSKVRRYNAQRGSLNEYDCPKCLNKGNMLVVRDGREVYEECDCLSIRRTMQLIRKSGLEKMIQRCTFESYNASTDWQRYVYDNAKTYAEHPTGWFYFGGQVGAGKTHLCTAIVGKLLKRGIAVKYCLWRDESTRLKAVLNQPEFDVEIAVYKHIDCLYIDDLFKTKQGAPVTAADINIAFEILNYRYINDMLTILSSEKTLREILDIDQAIGSRIYEMAQGSMLNLQVDKLKNYRVNGEQTHDNSNHNQS